MAHSEATPLARTNVTLPAQLLEEVDRFAGPRGRSRYVAEAVAQRVRRDALGLAIQDSMLLHDRYLIVDETSYNIPPASSAAREKRADVTLGSLSVDEFESMWSRSISIGE